MALHERLAALEAQFGEEDVLVLRPVQALLRWAADGVKYRLAALGLGEDGQKRGGVHALRLGQVASEGMDIGAFRIGNARAAGGRDIRQRCGRRR